MPYSQCTIRLNGIRLYGHHGCSAQEQQVGSWYMLDIAVEADITPAALQHDELSGTIDYSVILQTVKAEFHPTAQLLEHIAWRIAKAILADFPAAKAATVTVQKLAPPMPGNIAGAAVTLTIESPT